MPGRLLDHVQDDPARIADLASRVPGCLPRGGADNGVAATMA